MRAEERIGELEAENATLRGQLAEALGKLAQALERIHELKGQLAKDSHNSSKPPSSDRPGRTPRSQRHRSEKQTGGQPGHAGRTLMQVANPDEVVCHRPVICDHCQHPLEGVVGCLKESRQVHDLPEVRLVVQEHQVEEVCCPAFQQVSRGSFPAGVEATVQYGPKMRALAAYLHEYQLVPLARVSELLADLYACAVSEGTLMTWVQLAAQQLEPTVARIADWLSAGPLQHADETGVRVAGKRRWLHINSTCWLT
jgi:transposase